MHVLFVCTGNICRSPIAERLTVAYFQDDPGDTGHSMTAASAGTNAVIGHPIEKSASLVLRGLGGDAAGFQARQLTPDLIEPADLVITMSRRQRHAVLRAAPRKLFSTFTLREAASLLAAMDPASLAEEPDPASRARRLLTMFKQLRATRGERQGGNVDDIRDPIGQDLQAFQRVGDSIATSLLPLLDALAGKTAAMPVTQIRGA